MNYRSVAIENMLQQQERKDAEQEACGKMVQVYGFVILLAIVTAVLFKGVPLFCKGIVNAHMWAIG